MNSLRGECWSCQARSEVQPNCVHIAAIADRGGNMKRTALSILWLLIPTLTLAQTYSNANLNGKYSFQFATPAYDT
jgi:hypothetical protein